MYTCAYMCMYSCVSNDIEIRADVTFQNTQQAGGAHQHLAQFLARPCNAELARIVSTKLTTVAQISCLVPTPTAATGDGAVHTPRRGVVVVNTHLFFHPGASHIRLLLLSAILTEVKEARSRWERETGAELAIVFAGDFNSEPGISTYTHHHIHTTTYTGISTYTHHHIHTTTYTGISTCTHHHIHTPLQRLLLCHTLLYAYLQTHAHAHAATATRAVCVDIYRRVST